MKRYFFFLILEFVGAKRIWVASSSVASLIFPGGQESYFPQFFLKFWSIFLIFHQTLLIFFLILALRVGESPTWKSTVYATGNNTNETGPLPLCTFSVMGLSMCSSIFSESSPVRSKSGIINELSGLPNSVPTVRCSYTSSSWHGHTGHAYCICFVGKH